jgi:tRNA(fMet)-specific endonuclease VapC
MSLYILDTDILTLALRSDPSVTARLSKIPPEELAITVISVEEQLTGWYTYLRRGRKREEIAYAYARLAQTVTSLANLPILTFTEAAIDRFEQLKRMRLNVGSNDLRIAAIVLENNGVLVTRNLRDFQCVPDLRIEIWAA